MSEFTVRYIGGTSENISSADTKQELIDSGVYVKGIAIYDEGYDTWEADYDLQFVDIVKAAVLLYNHELIDWLQLRDMLQQFETDI
jgi:hypothetical protein